jgi:hypothetical protein
VERVKRKVYELAHCRAGDKGNTLTLSLICYDEKQYPLLCAKVSAEAVKRHMQEIIAGEVIRYELPSLSALQFVCSHALMGGVTNSLVMDTHGKSLSYALLEMEIEDDL